MKLKVQLISAAALILAAAGATLAQDANAQDNDGSTKLILAASGGDAAGVKAILAAGAAVNTKNGTGVTAIIYAAGSKRKPGRR